MSKVSVSALPKAKPSEIREMVRMQMRAEKKMTIGIVGHQGIGKSQMINQIAKEEGYKCVAFYASQCDSTEIQGHPQIDKESGRMTYAKPYWFPNEGEKVVLVLEEINRASKDVQQAILQLLNPHERGVGSYMLPKETVIVVCINPPNDIYDVTDLEPVMRNRAAWIELSADADEWLKYAYTNGLNDDVIKYIGLEPKMLSVPAIDKPCPSPRTWEMVSRVCDSTKGALRETMIAGLIGVEACAAFLKTVAKGFVMPVRGREILEAYDKVQDRVAAQVSNKERNDENYYTVHDVMALLASMNSRSLTDAKVKNLTAFFTAQPAEWQDFMIKDMDSKVLAKIFSVDKSIAGRIMAIRGTIDDLLNAGN